MMKNKEKMSELIETKKINKEDFPKYEVLINPPTITLEDGIIEIGVSNIFLKNNKYYNRIRYILDNSNDIDLEKEIDNNDLRFKPNLNTKRVITIFDSYKEYLLTHILSTDDHYCDELYFGIISNMDDIDYIKSYIVDCLNEETLHRYYIDFQSKYYDGIFMIDPRQKRRIALFNIYNFVKGIRKDYIHQYVPDYLKIESKILLNDTNITLLELFIYIVSIVYDQLDLLKSNNKGLITDMTDIFDSLLLSIYSWVRSQYYVSKDNGSENVKNAINEWIDHYNSYGYIYDWEKCKFEKRDPQNPLHNKIYLTAKYIGDVIYRYNKKCINVDQDDLEKLYKIIGIYMNKESDE